ncbi:MAG: hypothetical protein RL235_1101, partial [Chlamydiota bacterium]
APTWQRGVPYDVRQTLQSLGQDPDTFDLIIESPSPTDWVQWQRGHLIPKLKWQAEWDELYKNVGLAEGYRYIGLQPEVETKYGLWRSWPKEHVQELIDRLARWPQIRVVLIGQEATTSFLGAHVIDLRGKTNLYELLSLVQHRFSDLIVPDSGILSMVYYLDVQFPLRLISLWADPSQGVLKQAVASPNSQLCHVPLVGERRNLSTVSAEVVIDALIPSEPLAVCRHAQMVAPRQGQAGCIILAGGQGTRLGHEGPKGTFVVAGKSLLQWIIEKAPPDFPIAVMTSPLNHAVTVQFLEEHRYFGRNVRCFSQTMGPILDQAKRPIPGAQAPDGNGALFRSFEASGLSREWEEEGITQVVIVPVDNALADPCDLLLLGLQIETGADATIKCVPREPSDTSMGALSARLGAIEVTEYIAMNQKIRYVYSYIGIMALKLSFIRSVAGRKLPVRWVWKAIPQLKAKFAWKGEQFIFDALIYAAKVEALCDDRIGCYAPLKRADQKNAVEARLSQGEK